MNEPFEHPARAAAQASMAAVAAGDRSAWLALFADNAVVEDPIGPSMFDPEGEKSFIADCHDTLARRTVILITHRPASLALADRVLRLEAGRIVELTATQHAVPSTAVANSGRP